MFLRLLPIFWVAAEIWASPLLGLIASASSASSGIPSNVVSLRRPAQDDLFTAEDGPSLLTYKFNKVLQKVHLLTGGDDAQNKEPAVDDFDKDFNDGFDDLKAGYVYERPVKLQTGPGDSGKGLSPSSVGVFFMELIGSVIGLVYGAAAQFNYSGTSTAAPEFV